MSNIKILFENLKGVTLRALFLTICFIFLPKQKYLKRSVYALTIDPCYPFYKPSLFKCEEEVIKRVNNFHKNKFNKQDIKWNKTLECAVVSIVFMIFIISEK